MKIDCYYRNEKPLLRHGFKKLGSGTFATVYAHYRSAERVLKVSAARDDMWPSYVDWATRAGFAGGTAPVVHSFKAIATGGYLSVVEKLLPLHEYARRTQSIDGVYHSYRVLSNILCYGGDTDELAGCEYLGDDVKEFVKAFRDKFKKRSPDIHHNNIMGRESTNTLVVTDPLSWSGFDVANYPFRIKSGTSRLSAA